MTSVSPSMKNTVDNETLLDLQTTFAHPAGLRLARNIVRTVLANSRAGQTADQSSLPQHPSSSVTPTLLGSTSPEVAQILNDLLAFGDSGTHISTSQEAGMGGYGAEPSSGARLGDQGPSNAAASNPSFYHYPNSDATSSSTSRIQNTKPSTQSMNSFPKAPSQFLVAATAQSQAGSFECLDVDGSRILSRSSSTQGTESPYHVESPSGRVSAGALPQRSNDLHSSVFYNLEDDAMQLDSLPSLGSLHPRHNKSTLDNVINSRPARSEDKLPYGGFAARFPAPTIKSFLPVNKIVGGDSGVKDPQHQTSSSRCNSRPILTKPHSPPPVYSATLPYHHPSYLAPFRSSNNNSPLSENTDSEMGSSNEQAINKKRKAISGEVDHAKKQKPDAPIKKRVPKVKVPKPHSAKDRLTDDLWMRILEFTPPSFLRKARLINSQFKGMVDGFESICVNQRKENYGKDMPDAPVGLSQRQYTDLLGGKGCLEPGCDDEKASRTHWSWAKRWCSDCWRSKIIREDRVIKHRQSAYTRVVITKMLECIPVGMHDSFMKPHDFVDDVEGRPRGAPRLYRYYLLEDVDTIIAKYEAFSPGPYEEDPTQTAAQKAAAHAAYTTMMNAVDQKRTDFFAIEKKKNGEHMENVKKIEAAIRKRRELNAQPYDVNRKARKELFTRRAQEDLPQIPSVFVQSTKAFRAATRIFRDKGTERGWQTLKPKIEKEWATEQSKIIPVNAEAASESLADNIADSDQAEDEDDDTDDDVPNVNTFDKASQRPNTQSTNWGLRQPPFPLHQLQRMTHHQNTSLGSSMSSSTSMSNPPSAYGGNHGANLYHNRPHVSTAPRNYVPSYSAMNNFPAARGIAQYNLFPQSTMNGMMPDLSSSHLNQPLYNFQPQQASRNTSPKRILVASLLDQPASSTAPRPSNYGYNQHM